MWTKIWSLTFRILEKLKCFESQTTLFRGLIKGFSLEINCWIGTRLPQIGGVNRHRRTEVFEPGASGWYNSMTLLFCCSTPSNSPWPINKDICGVGAAVTWIRMVKKWSLPWCSYLLLLVFLVASLNMLHFCYFRCADNWREHTGTWL